MTLPSQALISSRPVLAGAEAPIAGDSSSTAGRAEVRPSGFFTVASDPAAKPASDAPVSVHHFAPLSANLSAPSPSMTFDLMERGRGAEILLSKSAKELRGRDE